MDTSTEERIKRHQDAAFHWNTLANQGDRDLTLQVLAFVSILLTLSLGILTNNDILLSGLQKIFLVISWVCFLISISEGIKQVKVDSDYFYTLQQDEIKRRDILEDTRTTDAEKEISILKLGTTRPKSSSKNAENQREHAFLGILFLTLLAVTLLFQHNREYRDYNKNLNRYKLERELFRNSNSIGY